MLVDLPHHIAAEQENPSSLKQVGLVKLENHQQQQGLVSMVKFLTTGRHGELQN